MSASLILSKKQIAQLDETVNVHQFNTKAIRHGKSLGDLVGLTRMGIHMVRVEPGDETTQYHNHENSDEFVYILAGEALLELDGESHRLNEGDFVGFPAGGACHGMKNSGRGDLVYLMGGGRPDMDICNYPKIQRRMYNIKGVKEFVDLAHLGKVQPKIIPKD